MAENKKLTCDIITPEMRLFSAQCEGVVAPAFDGLVGIKPGHVSFVTELGVGVAEISNVDDTGKTTVERFAIREGFLQVVDNKVTLLAVDAAGMATLPSKTALTAERDAVAARLAQTSKSPDEYEQIARDRAWIAARESLRPAEF